MTKRTGDDLNRERWRQVALAASGQGDYSEDDRQVAEELIEAQARVEPGQNVLIRTHTTYFLGLVIGVSDRSITLINPLSVAKTGSFYDVFASGEVKAAEPMVGPVYVYHDAIVDVSFPPVVKGEQ